MKQLITLGYELKEQAPIQIAFLSHEPLNFKQEIEIKGISYELTTIEKINVLCTPKSRIFASARLSAPTKRLTSFCVKDMDEVLNNIELDLGENKMFLHIVDINQNEEINDA